MYCNHLGVLKKEAVSIISGVARGIAGVAEATPIFQYLFYKIVPKLSQKFFLYNVGYTNLKFLTSSLGI